jgi:hypothetical protein
LIDNVRERGRERESHVAMRRREIGESKEKSGIPTTGKEKRIINDICFIEENK